MKHPLFSFIHVTDTHLREDLDVVTPFVGAVNSERHHPRPDLIFFGGDNVDGDRHDGTVCRRQMPVLKRCLDKLQVPHHIICHNHDTWAETHRGTAFREHIEERTEYTVDLSGGFAAIMISGCIMDGYELIEGIISRTAWLDNQLEMLADKKVLLFSHMPMFPPRKPVAGPRRSMMSDDRWEAHHYGYQAGVSKAARDVIAKHGNVIVHYSGHCHVNSVTESEGTHYIATAALSTQPWEYRYVEVYEDRMQHTCVRPHALDAGRHFWTNCVDADHPNVDLYHGGLPEERNFVLNFHDTRAAHDVPASCLAG